MNILSHFKIFFVVVVSLTISILAAVAETIEVSPGILVTKKSFPAVPPNEQPFYGFMNKTPDLKSSDDKFVDEAVKITGSRKNAFEATTKSGWAALGSGNLPEAGRRFNQAWLLAPEESAAYHNFAVLAQARFNDAEFSEELFKIALKQPNPMNTLNADYGRMLMIARRPRDAQPVLEQAVKDVPGFGSPRVNLGLAQLQNGDKTAACATAEEAFKLRLAPNERNDLMILKTNAGCP